MRARRAQPNIKPMSCVFFRTCSLDSLRVNGTSRLGILVPGCIRVRGCVSETWIAMQDWRRVRAYAIFMHSVQFNSIHICKIVAVVGFGKGFGCVEGLELFTNTEWDDVRCFGL